MRKYLIILALIWPVCLASTAKRTLEWSVSQDTMRIYVQEKAFEVQLWLLSNLTAEQRTQFETFLLPEEPTGEAKAAALRQALTAVERAGGDTSDLKSQIEAIDKSVEVVETEVVERGR